MKYTQFDAVGNVLASNQIIAGETYTFGYTYNLADSLVKETYPSGRAVTTDYDSANRPDATSGVLNGLSTPYASSVNYWPHGGLYYFVAGNNVVPVYNYNSRLQVSNFWATVGNDPNHFLLNIVPDWGASNNNGNLQSVQEGYGASVPWAALSWLGQNYSYDGVNRINSVIDTGYSRSFQYDAYGNMWVTTNSGVPLAGNTPTANVYTTANRIGGASYLWLCQVKSEPTVDDCKLVSGA